MKVVTVYLPLVIQDTVAFSIWSQTPTPMHKHLVFMSNCLRDNHKLLVKEIRLVAKQHPCTETTGQLFYCFLISNGCLFKAISQVPSYAQIKETTSTYYYALNSILFFFSLIQLILKALCISYNLNTFSSRTLNQHFQLPDFLVTSAFFSLYFHEVGKKRPWKHMWWVFSGSIQRFL